MATSLLKKMSAKNILGYKLKAPEHQIDLYTIMGVVSGVKSGEGDYGPWTSFTGSFEAVRIDNGDSYKSAVCFIPEPLSAMMADKFRGDDVTQLEFAIMVGYKPCDTPIGYEYTTEMLIDADESDPLKMLRDQVTLILPAPKKEEEKEEEKEEVKKAVKKPSRGATSKPSRGATSKPSNS